MHTAIDLGNSNCPTCLNAMVDDLRAHPQVTRVHSNAAIGCLEVEHNFEDPAEIIDSIRANLRGSVQASNGELGMFELQAHIGSRCPLKANPEVRP